MQTAWYRATRDVRVCSSICAHRSVARCSRIRSMSTSYAKHSVKAKDGTNIGYRRLGDGPGLILLHGGMKSSQDFMRLGEALSDTFTVYLPDRRGRGLSGPPGDHFGVLREVEDVQAVIAKTGAHNLFGLSSGALVALKTAVTTAPTQRPAASDGQPSIARTDPPNSDPQSP